MGWPDSGDTQSAGGPSDVEAYAVTLAEQVDSRRAARDRCADDRDEGKSKRNLAAAKGSNHPTATDAVQEDNQSRIEIVGEPLIVENIIHCYTDTRMKADDFRRRLRVRSRRLCQ
jgi:hypothetical protein